MYTPKQMSDPVIAQRISDERRESTPTPVWHLAKSAGVDEKELLHHLGLIGIRAFRWGPEVLWHVDKADVRKLIGLDGSE